MRQLKGRYLITGVASTGKSTICTELLRRGLPAFDTEAISQWTNRKSGQPASYFPGSDQGILNKIEWRLKPNEFELVLNSNPNIIICGLSANQNKYFHLFTKIFSLAVDEATLRSRLAQRSYVGAFGTDITEREVVLSTYKSFQAKMLAQNAIVISTSCSLKETVDHIMNEVAYDGR